MRAGDLHSHPHPARVHPPISQPCVLTDYANYLRFFERAAAAMLPGEALPNGLSFGVRSATGMRYAMAATLGDECEVRSTPLGIDDDGQLVAEAALVRVGDDGAERVLCSASDIRFGFASASTGEPCGEWPLPDLGLGPAPEERAPKRGGDKSPPVPPEAGSSPPLSPTLQWDELTSGSSTLSLHAAARYFERHRTLYIGGPGALAGLQASGVNVVVGRINGLKLLPSARSVRAGAPLELRCRVSTRARGTQVVFEQWLHDGDGEPVARADVTCLCLDTREQKIVAAPQELQERLLAWGD